ncbi:MAG: hypothetical protein ACFFDN_20385 [Candidatus Hodarchaeota archaeon]
MKTVNKDLFLYPPFKFDILLLEKNQRLINNDISRKINERVTILRYSIPLNIRDIDERIKNGIIHGIRTTCKNFVR